MTSRNSSSSKEATRSEGAAMLLPFTKALSSFYGIPISPEILLNAKENSASAEEVCLLWTLLHAVVCKKIQLCRGGETPIHCAKINLLLYGYPSALFYSLKNVENFGSRELLRALAYAFTTCHISSAVDETIRKSIFHKRYFSEIPSANDKVEEPPRLFKKATDLVHYLLFQGGKVARTISSIVSLLSLRDAYSRKIEELGESHSVLGHPLSLIGAAALSNPVLTPLLQDHFDKAINGAEELTLWLKIAVPFYEWMRTVPRSFGYYIPLNKDEMKELKEIQNLVECQLANYRTSPEEIFDVQGKLEKTIAAASQSASWDELQSRYPILTKR